MPDEAIAKKIGRTKAGVRQKRPLTLILSPLRAGRGEQERTRLGSLFGDPDTVLPKDPLSLRKRERIRVRLDCMVTA